MASVGGGEQRQWLPAIFRPHAQQQDLHRPFTAHPQAPEQVITAAGVVGDHLGQPTADDLQGVFVQVRLQTAAGEQAGIFAVRRDQHQGAGLAVGRAVGMHHNGQRHGAPGTVLTLVKRQQRCDQGLHSSDYA